MEKLTAISVRRTKATFLKLVRQIESGSRREIVIMRAGKPVARLVSAMSARPIRLGVADGTFHIPDDLDAANPMIEKLFVASAKRR